MRQICRLFAAAVLLIAPLLGDAAARAETLTINSDRSGPRQKAMLAQIAQEFEQHNPGTTVTINTLDLESYKTAIRNFLATSPPDVAFWYTGQRMRAFTKRSLFDDVSDLFAIDGIAGPMRPFIPAVTDNGKQYMVPTTFSTWGFFFRKDLFEKIGAQPPKTWDELMAVAAKFKAAGIIPFTHGSRDLWANDLWFDYLDLRINGLDAHMQLMDGKLAYTDPRVRAVFAKWQEPIEKGYFLPNDTSYGWQEAVPFLAQGKAAMYLLGAGVLTSLPLDRQDDIGFFPFPQLDPAIPDYEEASLNGIFIPSGARNKALARKFINYLEQPAQLTRFAQAGGTLAARLDAEPNADRFLQAQASLIRGAAGTSQFYDRDTDPDMAQIGMNGFQEFTVHPERLGTILTRLEAARRRVFHE